MRLSKSILSSSQDLSPWDFIKPQGTKKYAKYQKPSQVLMWRSPIIWCKSSPQFDLPFIPRETHWLDHPSRYISSLQPIHSNVGLCFRGFWSMFSSSSYKGTNKRYKAKATLMCLSPIIWCKSSPQFGLPFILTETHGLEHPSRYVSSLQPIHSNVGRCFQCFWSLFPNKLQGHK